mgnify:CR=1 FL=1
MKGETLFENFREVSAKEWKQKIQYDLKGKDYNEEVVWDSPEGIKIKPFYHADDIENLKVESLPSTPWRIGQSIYAGNAIMANEKAHKLIKKGAEVLHFVIATETIDVVKLLNNIDLNTTGVSFDMQFMSKNFIEKIVELVSNSNNVYFQTDPIGHLARSGNWYDSLTSDFAVFNELIDINVKNLVSVDLTLYDNAGADISQQLAYALAHANEYLNVLHENGNLQKLKSIEFKVSVGGNYFFEIAKLKALRKLWKVLIEVYEISPRCHISTIPSNRNKTIFDFNVNMLRTTTECMSAVLGGSDTVYNLPYDSITNQLAEKALILFKSIEKEGGFLKQLKNHSIQNKIADSAKKQQEKFNDKKAVLVGTNAYQNDSDSMGGELEIYPFLKKKPRKTLITPIIEKRLAEELEQNRLSHE